jgi:hypothetical protein
MGDTKVVNGAVVTEIEIDPSKTNDQLEREGFQRKRPAPSDAHKYEIAKIKTFRGMEGHGLNAILLRDHVKVADILDEGCGGEMHYDWIDNNKGVEESKFLAFIESERLKIPADKKDEDCGILDRDIFNGDCWVWDELNRIQNDRRNRTACKKYTIFQVGKDIGSEAWRQIKDVTPEIRVRLEKKYAGQKIRFMNDEYRA